MVPENSFCNKMGLNETQSILKTKKQTKILKCHHIKLKYDLATELNTINKYSLIWICNYYVCGKSQLKEKMTYMYLKHFNSKPKMHINLLISDAGWSMAFIFIGLLTGVH